MAGNNLTYIDFGVYEFEDMMKSFDEKTFNTLLSMKAHHTLISELPKIKVFFLIML